MNLYYIHDPMCSWCYAFDTVLKQVQGEIPTAIKVVKVLGGLAPDTTEIMPESLAAMIESNWQKIEQTVPNVRFNFDFWKINQAIRSTYPACRAVLTAKKQGADFEDKMITQIQWAYYQNAENPSLDKTLIKCAKQIELDSLLFISDYHSGSINKQLLQQIQFSRRLGVSTYPSLCLEINQRVLPIKIDYINSYLIVEQIVKAARISN
ncbi:MAG: DsbA family protein [Methylococcales bacterium]